MRVINNHKRILKQSKDDVSKVFKTLGTPEDKIWPYENWPAIKFKEGIKHGSKGGHGRIRYTIIKFEEDNSIKFRFYEPEGFNGTHEFKIKSIDHITTEISHVIQMKTTIKASFFWVFVIRWLHDALIEEAFDKVENHFSTKIKTTKYSFWVIFLREIYKRKTFKTKHA
ncbi:hypothetical protein A9Q86_13250 [Flavobacteriales bacterium 33_180_T64]|nr:hypothetical protein A9Q86_13250 [Flavobacteriales bacterium 33_180_T64]